MQWNIRGLKVQVLASKQEMNEFWESSQTGFKQWLTANPEFLFATNQSKEFKALFQTIPIVFDGAGLSWYWRFQNYLSRNPKCLKIWAWLYSGFSLISNPNLWPGEPERFKGSEILTLISAWGLESPIKLALVGGEDGAAELAAEKIKQDYSNTINVVYAQRGPNLTLNNYLTEDLSETLISGLKSAQPEILLVGMGNPKQDLWLNHFGPKIPNLRLGVGIGGAIDYWSGLKSRAPKWMHDRGLEWLWRLFQEPNRLKRILNALSFGWRMR